MTYDPNSDQEYFPEEQNQDAQGIPQQEEPAAFEEQPTAEPHPEEEFTGAYADNNAAEEPDSGYRGKFSAKASYDPTEEQSESPQDEPPVYGADTNPQPPEAAEPDYPAPPYPNQEDDYLPESHQAPYQEEAPQEPYTPDFDVPPAPQEPVRPRVRAIKKGRPRRRKGEGLFGIPNLLVTGVWVALTLLISLTLGRLVWVCAAEILAFGREDKTVTITVYETDTIDDITKKLARAELIHYPGLFKLYAQFAVDEGEIRPGTWDLNTKYDYHALVKMMSPSSTRSVVKVMIPEGYTCRQIFALLEENKVCTVQDITSYAAYGELNDYWFLEGVTRGDKYCLEGFLFPDTYEFYQNDTPKNVLTKMLNNFEKHFDESMQGKIQTLNAHLSDLMRRDGKGQDYINSHLFTVRDVVNVASMIEKETSSAQEGYTIASVIYNRLFCWQGNPAYLNIDATIVYALDGKTDLTAEDLRVDSPYNTYTHTGLTPGPISNPGLSSLTAALEPADTNYYYYVLDPTVGSHIFATTQAEHDANRAKVGG